MTMTTDDDIHAYLIGVGDYLNSVSLMMKDEGSETTFVLDGRIEVEHIRFILMKLADIHKMDMNISEQRMSCLPSINGDMILNFRLSVWKSLN